MTDDPGTPARKSTTGLNEELAGALAYVLGPFTGILFLLVEQRSDFVRFHARQSTAVFLLATLAHLVLRDLPIFGRSAAAIFVVGLFVLWLLLMFKAFNGEKYRVPYVGDWINAR
jgi:uncharacterized membrane protein